MTRHACYAPTSQQPIGGVVHLPAAGELAAPAVVLFPGLEAERIRIAAVAEAADILAQHGQPVLRLDYPGAGTSPGPSPRRDEAPGLFAEALSWFRELVGSATLAVGGTCAGGTMGLRLAADDPTITSLVVQGGRLRPRAGNDRSTLAAGLAAIDVLERVPRTERRMRGTNAVYEEDSWDQQKLEELERATEHATVSFICGESDPLADDVAALLSAPEVSSRVRASVEVVRLNADRVTYVQDTYHGSALTDVFVDRLGAGADG